MVHNKGHKAMRILIMVAGIFALAACDDSSIGGSDNGSLDLPDVEVAEAVTGVYGPIIYGNPDAKITVVEYASLTCPHCANFNALVFPEIKEKYLDTGLIRFEYRNFVMNSYDLAASVVARCETQDMAKKMHEAFFQTQSQWLAGPNQVDAMAGIARRLGMSRVAFDKCLADKDMQVYLGELTQHASQALKVDKTPTIFVMGDEVEGSSLDDMKADIFARLDKALADAE